jgi:hypothetical protein
MENTETPTTNDRVWQVTRFCCSSGMCLDCRAIANGTARKRIIHADRLTEATARTMARNWERYDAHASRMPETT